jgi:hypothetical protein
MELLLYVIEKVVQDSDKRYTTLLNLSLTCSSCYTLLEHQLNLKRIQRRFPTLEMDLYHLKSRPKDTSLEIHWKFSLDYREHESGPGLRKALIDCIGKFSNLQRLKMDCDNRGSTTSCWSEIVVQLPKLTSLRVSH